MRSLKTATRTALLLLAGLLLAGSAPAAQNLLQNGDFNAAFAGSWNTWAYGGGWVGSSTNPNELYDGTQFAYAGGDNGGGAGLNQVLFAQAGVPYTLSCAAAANSGWGWPRAEMRLIFLDGADAELLNTNYNCADAITANNQGLPWSNYTFTVTSPAGTVKLKVEFAGIGQGTVRFDSASLTAPLVYPTIGNVSPDGSILMLPTNTFSFTAASTATAINDSGIKLVVNGVDVSSSLVFGGSSMSKNVSYGGILTNRVYNIAIQVTDALGLVATRTVTFDTFEPANYTWEAEDYDYNGGQYFDNPQTNAYFGLIGSAEIDYHDTSGTQGNHDYRTSDATGTEVTGDAKRVQYLGINDYNIGWYDANDWNNYTRNFPSGLYNVYARMASPGSSTLSLSRVTSGYGTATQTTEPLGSFVMEGGLGWSIYGYVPLTDASGNMVKLSLGGLATLRATAGGNANSQFFMLVPANTNLPSITGLYPDGAVMFQPTNKLSFTAHSTAGINPGNITVTLTVTNNVQQYSTNLTSANGLTITGDANTRSVSYAGLVPQTRYTAVIKVTDLANNTITLNPKFDTYSPVLTFEAEDWDYEGGQYLNNPAPNAYANRVGYEGIDYHDANGTGNHPYRPGDTMSADGIQDTPRAQYVAASAPDYAVGYFASPEWINYTRTYPAGTYNIYGRFAAGGATSGLSLALVTSGAGTTTQTLQPLGTFTVANTGGWGTFQFVPLRDAYGNLAEVTLSGAKTLQLKRTSGEDANVNFLMVVPAETALPRISQVTPNTWMQSTNKLTFVASSGSGIATSNIIVTLNGAVASNVAYTGSATSWTGSCPLAPSAVYAATIAVTDNNGLRKTVTVNFDTFSADAYTWEAEDFDFGNGQFHDNPQVNAYVPELAFEGVDFHETGNGGTLNYRGDGTATEVTADYLRPQYNGTGFKDYNIGYTATGEWENYTRTYPTGTFNVYFRAARGNTGTTANKFQRVTGGWGTTNQTTVDLGTFPVPPTGGWQNWTWVPMTDDAGQLARLTLGGTNTFRLNGGGFNGNFFLLAPALALTSSASNGSLKLSFTTQAGFTYSLLSKTSLNDAAWTEVYTVAGDGTDKSQTYPIAGGNRFYILQAR